MNRMLILLLFASSLVAGENWPEFRGPSQQGHSDSTGLPVKWSESENVRFKTAIQGEGWSSPVVWGEQVWMTTATENGRSLRAVCVDRDGGRMVHDVEIFRVEQPERKNPFNSYASPTPVLEKGRVYVSFGTNGNACLDAESGRVLWRNRDLRLDHKEGPGSSPILYGNFFILHCDGMDVQYVAALDKHTGRLAWKTPRSYHFGMLSEDLRKAYSTPLIIRLNGKDQMISIGARRVSSYDPATGKEIWWCDIPGYSNAPRPVYAHGLVFVSTGFDSAQLWAIRPDGKGDVTKSHVAWKVTQGVPLKPSVLLVGEEIYMVSDNGIARCLDAKSGSLIWQGRIGTAYSASPSYADGLIYFCSEKGKTTVIKPGKELAIVAENSLDGRILASPAVAGKALFIRTDTHLYRIQK